MHTATHSLHNYQLYNFLECRYRHKQKTLIHKLLEEIIIINFYKYLFKEVIGQVTQTTKNICKLQWVISNHKKSLEASWATEHLQDDGPSHLNDIILH